MMQKFVTVFGCFRPLVGAAIALLVAPACLQQDGPPIAQKLDSLPEETAMPAHLSALPAPGSPEAVGALVVANDCRVTTATLADVAGLYAHAAEAIILQRAGADGTCGTSDDLRFRSLDDILDLPYVGPRNTERLVRFAETAGAVPLYEGGTVEGVHFSDAEAWNALVAANGASFERLDQEAGLRSDAVRNIIDARPLTSLRELAAVYRVGPRTLEQLRNWASPRVQGSFILTKETFATLEHRALEFLLENEVFAWDLVQLADYDETALAEIQEQLIDELRRRVEASLFGRPYPSSQDALNAILQTASAIQRHVRVDGWSYLRPRAGND